MTVHSGNELREYVNASLNSEFKERFLLKDLHSYMTSKNDAKVMCLYGLKNTGKATMALQEMRNLGDYDNMLHIVCGAGDKMYDISRVLCEAVKSNADLKYIFIDEITKAERFIDTCSFLADAYSVRGIKVVLYGTNSLGFHLATGNELFDRVHLLHTTYIPFKEYNYLLGRNIYEYIEYGGVLNDAFCSSDTVSEYINSAIVNNICSTINNWGIRGNYALNALREAVSRGEPESFVREVFERQNTDFIKHDDQPKSADDEKPASVILHYLKAIDAVYEILPNVWLGGKSNESEYIFTQTGLRFSTVKSLSEDEKIIKNKILEDAVFYQLYAELNTRSRDVSVMKFKKVSVAVLDFITQAVCLIEVKYSQAQTNNLCDDKLCAEIEQKAGMPIANKAVVYLGKSGEQNGVLYINAEEFLCRSQEFVRKMLEFPHMSEFRELDASAQENGF